MNVSTELPKSFIVCSDEKNRGEIVVYISQISCATLKKRSGYVDRLGLAE